MHIEAIKEVLALAMNKYIFSYKESATKVQSFKLYNCIVAIRCYVVLSYRNA